MKNIHVSALCLTVALLLPAAPSSAGHLYCDDYGICTGYTDDGESIRLYTDDYGNTTGTIGDSSVRLYSDDYGNTTGSIGSDSFRSYSDDYGNTDW